MGNFLIEVWNGLVQQPWTIRSLIGAVAGAFIFIAVPPLVGKKQLAGAVAGSGGEAKVTGDGSATGGSGGQVVGESTIGRGGAGGKAFVGGNGKAVGGRGGDVFGS